MLSFLVFFDQRFYLIQLFPENDDDKGKKDQWGF